MAIWGTVIVLGTTASRGLGCNVVFLGSFFFRIYIQLIGSEIRPSTKKMYKTLKITHGIFILSTGAGFLPSTACFKRGRGLFSTTPFETFFVGDKWLHFSLFSLFRMKQELYCWNHHLVLEYEPIMWWKNLHYWWFTLLQIPPENHQNQSCFTSSNLSQLEKHVYKNILLYTFSQGNSPWNLRLISKIAILQEW